LKRQHTIAPISTGLSCFCPRSGTLPPVEDTKLTFFPRTSNADSCLISLPHTQFLGTQLIECIYPDLCVRREGEGRIDCGGGSSSSGGGSSG
ncbi:hypothetical protein LEMLEM_LOCUS6273, partial [Lemmus lemmus]